MSTGFENVPSETSENAFARFDAPQSARAAAAAATKVAAIRTKARYLPSGDREYGILRSYL
jgi:hypothetical protein